MTTHPEITVNERPHKWIAPKQEGRIYACAAGKGGTGKSRLSRELAAALEAVAVDLEWDRGGISRSLGYKEELRVKAPLLDALEKGRTPRPISGRGRKPDLIPGHRDFGYNQPDPNTLAEALVTWAGDLERDLLIDTHPGGSDSVYGAMMAADVIFVPIMYATEDLNALEGFLEEASAYPIILIPYQTKRVPPAHHVRALERLSERFDVPIGPRVDRYSWLPDRKGTVPIVKTEPSKTTAPFIKQITDIAEVAKAYGR